MKSYYHLAEEQFENKEYEKAIALYKQGIEQGEIECLNALAYCFDEGYGVEINKEKALELYTKAAEEGYVKSQRNLGIFYQERKQEELAFKWFKKAAKNGVDDCIWKVATRYEMGLGTQKDLDNAIKWYKKGVELKNPYAAIRIARIYENYEQMEDIIYWYKQAADLGLARAQCYYGFCMYQKEKYEEAVKYFKLAANQGNQEAIAHLGYCYIYGHGVNKDIDYGIELVEGSGLDYALIPEEVYDEED